MGSEDFAFYLDKVPGSMLFLGTGNEKKGAIYAPHSPYFFIDEDVLPIGASIHAAFAHSYLSDSTGKLHLHIWNSLLLSYSNYFIKCQVYNVLFLHWCFFKLDGGSSTETCRLCIYLWFKFISQVQSVSQIQLTYTFISIGLVNQILDIFTRW